MSNLSATGGPADDATFLTAGYHSRAQLSQFPHSLTYFLTHSPTSLTQTHSTQEHRKLKGLTLPYPTLPYPPLPSSRNEEGIPFPEDDDEVGDMHVSESTRLHKKMREMKEMDDTLSAMKRDYARRIRAVKQVLCCLCFLVFSYLSLAFDALLFVLLFLS